MFGVRRKLFMEKKSFILQRDATEYVSSCFSLDSDRNFYFKGVWINEKYFRGIEDTLKSTFIFPKIVDKENMSWQKIMEQTSYP